MKWDPKPPRAEPQPKPQKRRKRPGPKPTPIKRTPWCSACRKLGLFVKALLRRKHDKRYGRSRFCRMHRNEYMREWMRQKRAIEPSYGQQGKHVPRGKARRKRQRSQPKPPAGDATS